MSRNYICERHDYCLKNLSRVRDEISRGIKFNKDDVEALVDLLDSIDSDIYDIIDEIECVKEMGIKMETRLSNYRMAIEDLGFQRINN